MDVREKSLNEKRLIDANALKRVLLPITSALEHEYGSLGGAVSGVIKHIDSAPTIDAAPVVRCCECKFGVTPYGDEHDGWIECSNIHGRPLFGCNDFCSYGERKDSDWND